MIRQLSFDTSTANVHVALLEDEKSVVQRVVEIDREASSGDRQEIANLLIPTFEECLNEIGWTRHDLDCLIVGSGPGGFTGVRTGVVTARALAQALSLPLLAVSSLESISLSLPTESALLFFATTAHFYGAKGRLDNLSCQYISLANLNEFLKGEHQVFVDSKTMRELEAQSAKPLPDGHLPLNLPPLQPLPELANMAVAQASSAWPRLSLKVGEICERLKHTSSHMGASDEESKLLLRQELCREFPYDAVLPTYLRAPSVTLKKTNV
ncbi:MAG TPA: tRNA (adenosine(37)-N6)-threonylcarbamoyltransferase complex dimerization subunit type 1 TsaB [Oculatellaceae cyanobacterium]